MDRKSPCEYTYNMSNPEKLGVREKTDDEESGSRDLHESRWISEERKSKSKEHRHTIAQRMKISSAPKILISLTRVNILREMKKTRTE